MKDQFTSEQKKKTFFALLLEASELRRKKKYEAAIEVYLEATRLFDENGHVYAAIASCCFLLNRFEEAVAWMKKAVILEPDNAQFHDHLASYLSLGTLDYHQAVVEYRKALSLNPNYVDALIGAGALYGVPEDVVTLKEAIEWLKRATELQPNDANWHARLAGFYHEAGNTVEEEREWIRALLCPQPLSPGYVQAFLNDQTA